jgi:hypothetical protein
MVDQAKYAEVQHLIDQSGLVDMNFEYTRSLPWTTAVTQNQTEAERLFVPGRYTSNARDVNRKSLNVLLDPQTAEQLYGGSIIDVGGFNMNMDQRTASILGAQGIDSAIGLSNVENLSVSILDPRTGAPDLKTVFHEFFHV